MKKDIKQLFEKYIDECINSRGLRPETIKGYKAVFDHFSTMMSEVVEVESLTAETMNLFFKRIRTRKRIVGKDTEKIGLEDSTIKTYGNKLNAFFVWLIKRGFMTKNPLDTIQLKFPQYNDQRALKPEEVHKIISAVSLNPKDSLMLKRDTMMLYLLLLCGLRSGEFISLRLDDFDMQKGKEILTVRAETSKSKRSRNIPIHPTLLVYLREYIEERDKHGYKTEYLIVSSAQDKGLSRHGLKHWVKRLNQLSGVKFHLHRFRHTFACNCAKANMSIIKIRDLMGHRSVKMTEVYLRSLGCEDCRDDIKRMKFDN